MILLGLKCDLRGQEVNGCGYTEVPREDAKQLAKDLGEEFTFRRLINFALCGMSIVVHVFLNNFRGGNLPNSENEAPCAIL